MVLKTGELLVFEDAYKLMRWFYGKTNSDNWHHSTVDKIETTSIASVKLHTVMYLNQYREDDTVIGHYHALYILGKLVISGMILTLQLNMLGRRASPKELFPRQTNSIDPSVPHHEGSKKTHWRSPIFIKRFDPLIGEAKAKSRLPHTPHRKGRSVCKGTNRHNYMTLWISFNQGSSCMILRWAKIL